MIGSLLQAENQQGVRGIPVTCKKAAMSGKGMSVCGVRCEKRHRDTGKQAPTPTGCWQLPTPCGKGCRSPVTEGALRDNSVQVQQRLSADSAWHNSTARGSCISITRWWGWRHLLGSALQARGCRDCNCLGSVGFGCFSAPESSVCVCVCVCSLAKKSIHPCKRRCSKR